MDGTTEKKLEESPPSIFMEILLDISLCQQYFM